MPASGELPRGVSLTANVLSGNSTVTFPAIPGIAWVLTSAHAAGNSGYTGAYSVALVVNGATLDSFSGEAAVASQAQANAQFDGEIPFPMNTAVTVTASQTGTLNTVLVARAYPI